MFIGEYTHNVDTKGRLAIPVKMRLDLAEGAIVTRGFDKCLFVYPKAQWEKVAEQLAALPISQPKTRAFARLFLAGAMAVELDRLGRILLPNYLRQYASLKNQAVVAGLYNRLEIWDEKLWDEYKKNTEKDENEIAAKMEELGF